MLNIKKYAINNKGIGFKKRIGVIVVSITNANPFDLDLWKTVTSNWLWLNVDDKV